MKHQRLTIGIISLSLLICSYCSAEPLNTTDHTKRIFWTNALGTTLITAWGLKKWDYGEKGFHSRSEGWFGHNTYTGGSDKFGHAYSAYVLTRGLSYYYQTSGLPKDKAAKYGALSSFGLLSYMELGDGFSDFGFSYEDFLVNGIGTTLGYWLFTNEDLAEKIDFRVEYKTSFSEADVFNEYDKMKYLFAFKLSGYSSTRNSLLKYIELHLGYFSRGYDDRNADKYRATYAGLGINLAEILKQYRSTRKASAIFNYLQLPNTYLTYKYRLDDSATAIP